MTVVEFNRIQAIEAVNARFMNRLAHDMAGALSECENARLMALEAGYRKGVLDAESNRAWYHIFRCEFDQAFPLAKNLPEKYDAIGDRYGSLVAINTLGVIHLDMGNYDHALPYFLACLEKARQFDEKEREASALANIGLLYNEMDRIEEAFDYFSSALNIKELNDTCFYTASKCIALYHMKKGEYDRAEQYLKKAEALARRKRDIHFVSEILATRGLLCRTRKKFNPAGLFFQKSLSISRDLGNVKIETENLYELGCLSLDRGDTVPALAFFHQALDLAVKKEIGNFKCRCYQQLSAIHEQKQDFSQALFYLKQFNGAEKAYNMARAELRIKSLGFEHELEQKKQEAEIYRLKNIALEKANQKIMKLANHDNLTGLPNRRLFMEHLQASVHSADRNHHMLAILFIDLDDFKPVNDRFGHQTGDMLLCQVAEKLTAALRKTDVVARFGGDEFAIIVPELTGMAYVHTVARKILELFDREFTVDGHRCRIGASIGISLYPGDAGDLDSLLTRADKAMYAAKMGGKNAYMFCHALPGQTESVKTARCGWNI